MMADIIVAELRDYEIARYYAGIYNKSALIEGAYEAFSVCITGTNMRARASVLRDSEADKGKEMRCFYS